MSWVQALVVLGGLGAGYLLYEHAPRVGLWLAGLVVGWIVVQYFRWLWSLPDLLFEVLLIPFGG